MLSALATSMINANLFAYCENNAVNMGDEDGYWPKWLKKTVKIVAAVAVVVVAVALTTVTFGACAPIGMVAAAAAIGALAGAGVNVAKQYFTNGKSFKNFNIDSAIMAGVQGGLSGVLSMTGIGVLGQVIGNALISGGGSALKGDKLLDLVFNSAVGGLAGLAGGSGTGYGGLYFSEALREKVLMSKFLSSLVKSSAVSNSPRIVKVLKDAIKKLSN